MSEFRPMQESPPIFEADRPDQALEAIRAQWGNLGFENDPLTAMWYAAIDHASILPYHNFQHTLDTLWAAMELADRLEGDGYSINRRVLVGAALFHDADYHKPSKKSQPASKESRSAKLFAKLGCDFGYDEAEIELGRRIIKDTSVYREPSTPESKVLIRADLINLSDDYDTRVFKNTRLLHKESLQMGINISSKKHIKSSVRILTRYLKKDLSLGPNDSSYDEWLAYSLDSVRTLGLSIEGRRLPKSLRKLIGSSAIKGAHGST